MFKIWECYNTLVQIFVTCHEQSFVYHFETLGLKRTWPILRLCVVLWLVIFQATFVAGYVLYVSGFCIQVALSRRPCQCYRHGSLHILCRRGFMGEILRRTWPKTCTCAPLLQSDAKARTRLMKSPPQLIVITTQYLAEPLMIFIYYLLI